MPIIDFHGKKAIQNYEPPYHILEEIPELNYQSQVEGNSQDNILVEGDNLFALKSLLPEYEGKIKCIYIDPPYNTNNKDWVYCDNIEITSKNDPAWKQVEKFLKDGNEVDYNDQSRHSKWLCMMYPRLKLLHKLLKEDGVIFVSIDDNEVHHLRMIMDEIWGEQNFVSEIVWHSKYTTSNDAKYISRQHEYILMYSKNKEQFEINLLPRTQKQDKDYKNPDNDPKGAWKATPLHAKSGTDKSLYKIEFANGKFWEAPQGRFPRYSKINLQNYFDNGELYFNSKGGIDKKTYLNEVKQGITAGSIFHYDEVGHTHFNNEQIANIVNKGMFENPKGTLLVQRCMQLSTDKNSIILDSFAGSGTTAHAVLDLNNKDGGNRKFITIQLPETIKEDKPAYQAGYKFVHEITRERIKRVAEGYKFTGKKSEVLKSYKLNKKNLKIGSEIIDELEEMQNNLFSNEKLELQFEGNEIQFVKEVDYKSQIPGLGGGFKYYRIGTPLFTKKGGDIVSTVTWDQLAPYLYFTEFRKPIGGLMEIKQPFVGSYSSTELFLIYKEPNTNVLTERRIGEILKLIKKGNKAIVYADNLEFGLDETELKEQGIVFKQIPYDVLSI